MFGRAPTAADPIVPRATEPRRRAVGGPHTEWAGGDLVDQALAMLDLPRAPMRVHALQSTFISMALEDVADRELVKRITHPPLRKPDAFDATTARTTGRRSAPRWASCRSPRSPAAR